MALNRSQQMSRIRGRNTSPEQALRRGVWNAGLRYRLHAVTPAGKPDLVFIGKKVAVFIDGCFWHGCPDHYVRPRSRDAFWAAKLDENIARDRRQTLELEAHGWRVCRLWEHEVFEHSEAAVAAVVAAVREPAWHPLPSWRVVRVEVLSADGNAERRWLEDLRDPGTRQAVEQKRSTRKWTRPRR